METPVLHVLVVGFHHKKGCQVEFSYPPLIEGNSVESHEIPEEWKHIPSLALPDGAHNYVKDTVYFVLPGRKENLQTVYCVSCYRQMDAKDLKNKTADVTRSTVQKSVCVLSRLPLFGLIQAKLELITHAYFDERDFSQVSLLEQTFNNLNSSLTQSLLSGTQIFLGLSVRDLVILYKHKIIILFKLLLLERRVLLFGSPVENLCQTLLGFLSLFPGMLENGLAQACNQWNEKKLSPTLAVANFSSDQDEDDQFLEVRYHSSTPESSLSELMGHIHNSALNIGASGDLDYTSLDIAGEVEGQTVVNTSEAPEPPSIPRDPCNFNEENSVKKEYKMDSGSGNVKAGDRKDDSSNSVDASKPCREKENNNTLPRDSSHSQKSRSRSSSGTSSDKLTIHGFSKVKRHTSLDETKTHFTQQDINDHYNDSPLAHMNEITHLETVQSRVDSNASDQSFLEGDGNENAASQIAGRDRNGTLTLDSTKPRPEGDEWIEELDSPESISRIDREDCFSWEQDHLQLSFVHDHFTDDGVKKEPSTPTSSKSASRDSVVASESGRESVSSDSTGASASSREQTNKNKSIPSPHKGNTSDSDSPTSKQKKSKVFKNKISAAFNKVGNKAKDKDQKGEKASENHKGEVILQQDQFGYPLAIFTKGSVCYPYLSLQYHDILTDINTRSFVIGATNVLFKQRRQLIDVVVEIGEGKLDIRDKELQRQLSLTTADLRFAEYLVRTVTEEKAGLFLDGTEWEGSDEWIRAQFKHYMNSLLSSVLEDDPKLLEDFGSGFLSAWKTTHNFRYWQKTDHPATKEIPPGHPFQGNLSMADVRVRFNHTLQNTERGRKINAAVVQTGKYVVQTGKAVGGAFSSARSAVSGWFSSWRANDKVPEETEESEKAEDKEEPVTVQAECDKEN